MVSPRSLLPLQRSIPSLPSWAWAPAYLAAYVLLDWATYIRPVAGINVTPWNPQEALAIALLLWRPSAAWLVLLGALAGELLVRGMPADLLTPVTASSVVAITSMVTAAALRRAIDPVQLLLRRGQVLRFGGIALIASLAAGVGYVVSHTADLPEDAVSPWTVAAYWIGDGGALLLTLPALLLAVSPSAAAQW